MFLSLSNSEFVIQVRMYPITFSLISINIIILFIQNNFKINYMLIFVNRNFSRMPKKAEFNKQISQRIV